MFLLGDFEKSLVVWHQARQLRGNAAEVSTEDGKNDGR